MDLPVIVVNVALHELGGHHVERMLWIYQLLPHNHEQLQRLWAHRFNRGDILDVIVQLFDFVFLAWKGTRRSLE